MKQAPIVGVVMGSQSDFAVLQSAIDILKEFSVAHEARVVSAHRTPDWLFEYASTAEARGLRVLIAGAGGAAHLPGRARKPGFAGAIGYRSNGLPAGFDPACFRAHDFRWIQMLERDNAARAPSER